MSDNLSQPHVSRRVFVRLGAAAFSGLTLGDALRAQAADASEPAGGKAKSVIQLWMSGGPCHIDTFDPKPNAGPEYCGPYRKPIATNVDGIQLCEMLPLLAKQMDKFSILRGMTHGSNAHETATYMMQTGTPPAADLVYPAMGAVVAMKKTESGQYTGALPPYITIPQALGRFTEAGFLGAGAKTFATGGDPNGKSFSIGGLGDAAKAGRTQQRRELFAALDAFAKERQAEPPIQEMGGFQGKAYELILGDAKEAFDIAKESDAVRDRYGRTTFGQSCLLARRLVEKGVPFITVHWGGWDTHKQHFERMAKALPELDRAMSALLEDLAQRGLLETTIVTWSGEFGRTPKIAAEPPWEGGRHHFGNAFSAVVAGGGFQGGKVVGATDNRGERVTQRPIYPWDLAASIYKLLGIDPAGRLPHPRGCVAYVTPVASGGVASGGMLTEIM